MQYISMGCGLGSMNVFSVGNLETTSILFALCLSRQSVRTYESLEVVVNIPSHYHNSEASPQVCLVWKCILRC